MSVQLVDDKSGTNSVCVVSNTAPLDENLSLLCLNGGLILEPVHLGKWVSAEFALQSDTVPSLTTNVAKVFHHCQVVVAARGAVCRAGVVDCGG